MNDSDRRILTELQKGFPLTRRPFNALGERLGLSADTLLKSVHRLKADGYIRQISAIFDSNALGYTTSLVAFKIAPERLDASVEIINAHPGVSHNYLRNHEFNVWFTIAVPPGGDLEEDIATLARETQALGAMPLPTLNLYKIGVKLDLTAAVPEAETESENATPPPTAEHTPLTEPEIRAVGALQQDLELVEEPFAGPAKDYGMSEEELFEFANRFKEEGRMRRFAVVIRHRKAGYAANGMVTWIVPEAQQHDVGRRLAAFQAVSHCYRRPTYPQWPYSIFTMVHAKSEAECEKIAEQMSKTVGIDDYTILYSSREFKKVRVQYFTDAYATWKAAHPV